MQVTKINAAFTVTGLMCKLLFIIIGFSGFGIVGILINRWTPGLPCRTSCE